MTLEPGVGTDPRLSEDAAVQEGDCGGGFISFDEFVHTHGRTYELGSKEYEERKALFEKRLAEARAHNCGTGKRFWTAGATSLSDRTDEELDRLRGRRGGRGERGQPSSGGNGADRLATLESRASSVSQRRGNALGEPAPAASLPSSFSWSHLQAMKDVIDQGACGSCWASATVAMLRAHTDIYTQHQSFSIQQLVSCVPNPQQCGGNGGCNGSTGELALDYIMHNGLGIDTDFPYQDTDLPCPANMIARNPNPVPQPNSSSFLAVTPQESLSPAMSFGMLGWSRLPENQLKPLYHALYSEGPVAVSVVAGYAWNAYVSGIMNNCSKEDMVVNHLVVLIGYGVDDRVAAKYWQLQNSWGTSWGEGGNMRMIRQDDADEEAFCGMDADPLIGTGCKGGPPEVWVCGSCGILFDNVVAHFQGTSTAAQEMLQRREQNYVVS